MSTRVVSESHPVKDDYTWVPSIEDFEELESKVSNLVRKVTVLASRVSATDRSMKSVEESIEKQRTLLASLRKDMSKELTSGEWKRIIENTVNESVKALETVLQSVGKKGSTVLSSEIAKQMEQTYSLKNDSSVQGRKKIAIRTRKGLKKVR